jgi:hypothetical protein
MRNRRQPQVAQVAAADAAVVVAVVVREQPLAARPQQAVAPLVERAFLSSLKRNGSRMQGTQSTR